MTAYIAEHVASLPEDVRRHPWVSRAADLCATLELDDKMAALRELAGSRRAKPYLHAVETRKLTNVPRDVVAADQRPRDDTPLGTVYLHLPFCTKRCKWCHYYKEIDVDVAVRERFVELLANELEMALEQFLGRRVQAVSVHYGGGTPSLMSPSSWDTLTRRVAELVDLPQTLEIAVEYDPEDYDPSRIAHLADLGVNRLSAGIQSFGQPTLGILGRTHSASQAVATVTTAMERGIHNVNIDLMYGMPKRTLASWIRDLEQALATGAPSVTAYRTRSNPVSDPSRHFPSEASRVFDHAVAFVAFTDAGYFQFSPNQFTTSETGFCIAKQERNRCNDVLGVGPRAHSILGAWFLVNRTDLNAYREIVGRGGMPALRGARMTEREQALRFFQFGLKLSGYGKPDAISGVDLREYERRFGPELDPVLRDTLQSLQSLGLVERTPSAVRLTKAGCLVVDDVIRALTPTRQA